MTSFRPTSLPVLPLLLWDTPPGLELALAQEGVAYRVVPDPHPLAFQAGRFVLFDSYADNLVPGEIVLMHVGAANDGTTLDAAALPDQATNLALQSVS